MDILELTSLTQRLTQKKNVNVCFSMNGEAAAFWEDGFYNIKVPVLDNSLEALALTRGYLDHEAGHVLFTDFSRWSDFCRLYRSNNDVIQLVNIYEDVRVERLMGMTYPGSRHNLAWLARRLFKARLPAVVSHTLDFVLCYNTPKPMISFVKSLLLYSQRAQLVPELGDGLDDVIALLPLPENERVIALLKTAANSTAHSIELGIALSEELKSTTVSAPTDYMSKFQQALEDYLGVNSDQEDMVSSDPGALGVADFHGTLTGIACQHTPKNMGAVHNLAHESTTIRPMDCCTMPLVKTAVVKQIHLVSSHVRRVLAPLLQSMQYQPGARGWHGALDSRSLHRIGVGDGRVFARKSNRVVRKANVSMLCDCSGSMRDDLDDALVGMYGMWEGLSGVPGIQLKCYAFSSSIGDITPVRPGVYRNPKAGGSTYMGGAVLQVLHDLITHTGERNILFVFTDGVPDNSDAAREALAAAQRVGVELYGIGIGDDFLHLLLSDKRRATVHNMQTEFAPALQGLLTGALVHALVA